MLQLLPPKFQLSLIRRHEPHDIRRRAFEIQDLLKDYISAEVVFPPSQTPIPPNAVKFQIADGKRALVASDILVQMTLDFDGSLPGNKTLKAILEKPVAAMQKIEQFFGAERRYHAIVLQASRSNPGGLTEVSKFISDVAFSEVAGPGIASANYSKGDIDGLISRNIEAASYNFYEVQFLAKPGFNGFDADFLEPKEVGLQVKVEVNTKTSIGKNDHLGFSDLVDQLSLAAQHPHVEAWLGGKVLV